jgi:hypothetical protein
MDLEKDDSCPDCGRDNCWGGSVCSVIKKEKEKE